MRRELLVFLKNKALAVELHRDGTALRPEGA